MSIIHTLDHEPYHGAQTAMTTTASRGPLAGRRPRSAARAGGRRMGRESPRRICLGHAVQGGAQRALVSMDKSTSLGVKYKVQLPCVTVASASVFRNTCHMWARSSGFGTDVCRPSMKAAILALSALPMTSASSVLCSCWIFRRSPFSRSCSICPCILNKLTSFSLSACDKRFMRFVVSWMICSRISEVRLSAQAYRVTSNEWIQTPRDA
mmetsp:Transcript_81249/g.206364  ORF Transcript_81249/g.206364 Transcript_81249/m.206364 type:complete len:210 (-) Transcript_81249:1612-2241(-)